jgi:hypothetical protein
MEQVTLLIQGKILQSTYDFYYKLYSNLPIIVSTWENSDVKCDKNTTLIKSKYPIDFGEQNKNLQIQSTITGLSFVSTKYVIKLRGNEEYSNLEYAMDMLLKSDDKILTSPVFFRKWSIYPYHISDHILIGKTLNINKMFFAAASNNGLGDDICIHYDVPEQVLCKFYIEYREGIKLDNNYNNRKYMIKYFDIISLDNHIPYKIVANIQNKIWYSNFIPEYEGSISDITQI